MASQEALLVLCQNATDQSPRLYEAQVTDVPGKLAFKDASERLPPSPSSTITQMHWDSTASEIVMAGISNQGGQEAPRTVAVYRFARYLQLASEAEVNFKDSFGVDEVRSVYNVRICSFGGNVIFSACAAGDNDKTYRDGILARRSPENTFTFAKIKAGKLQGTGWTVEPILFYPEGQNFRYVYNIRRIGETPAAIYVETMTRANFENVTRDASLVWNQCSFDFGPMQFPVEALYNSELQPLMLYDENLKRYWLYILGFEYSGTLHYFRVPVRTDGSLMTSPLVKPEDATKLDFGFDAQGWLSTVTFSGRIWLFSQGKSGGVSYSCPVPKDGKLPDSVSGWTLNENILENAVGYFSALSVPRSYLE